MNTDYIEVLKQKAIHLDTLVDWLVQTRGYDCDQALKMIDLIFKEIDLSVRQSDLELREGIINAFEEIIEKYMPNFVQTVASDGKEADNFKPPHGEA